MVGSWSGASSWLGSEPEPGGDAPGANWSTSTITRFISDSGEHELFLAFAVWYLLCLLAGSTVRPATLAALVAKPLEPSSLTDHTSSDKSWARLSDIQTQPGLLFRDFGGDQAARLINQQFPARSTKTVNLVHLERHLTVYNGSISPVHKFCTRF